MPDEVIHPPEVEPTPAPSQPPASRVDPAVTGKQLGIHQELWDVVNTNYVDRDFNGHDWVAVGERYRAIVEDGLTDEDFYLAMELMIGELGDDHSRYDSPEQVRLDEEELAGQGDYVGIGTVVQYVSADVGAAILQVLPGGPAEAAGVRPHDVIAAIDGKPIIAAEMATATRGPEGTDVTITLERRGEGARDLVLTRARVGSSPPVDHCLILGTHIGYVLLPTLFDQTIPQKLRDGLDTLSADGPLEGLIIDNRINGGGSSTVLYPIMSYFTNGTMGDFVSRERARPWVLDADAVDGSQDVPLAVLVGPGTVSFGEIMTGTLQALDGAIVVGQTTGGNVETLSGYPLSDGSKAWIAHETFEPRTSTYGPWEDTGIIPDVEAPSRWDLFTSADDPALAAAYEALTQR
ncbi:MAG: S41 family peptidase [Candidatus Limnocylindrales bacterium]